MKMLLDGEWHNREETIDVTNPFDGSLIDTVPSATSEDVDLAISSAVGRVRNLEASLGS